MTHDTHYQRYHQHYNNDAFRALCRCIVCDLEQNDQLTDLQVFEASGKPVAHRLINLVTDAAIEATGNTPYPAPRFMELAKIAAGTLRADTIEVIAQYLERFDPDRVHAVVQDFRTHVRALTSVQSRDPHKALVEMTNTLHTNTGRAAYYLLVSAAACERASELALAGDVGEYLAEQVRIASANLQSARVLFKQTGKRL
jgi:hypothetical protein